MPYATSRHPDRARAFAGSIRQALTDAGREIPSDAAIEAAACWIVTWDSLETAFRANAPFSGEARHDIREVISAYRAALTMLAAKSEDAAVDQAVAA